MTPDDYRKQRLDPRWQKRRLEILDRDQFQCVLCDSVDSTLNVHHAYYVKGRMPWQYPSFALKSLCSKCHKETHEEAEVDFYFSEWEQEMEWMLLGDSQYAGAMWNLAAEIKQWCGEEFPTVVYEKIVKMIRTARSGITPDSK